MVESYTPIISGPGFLDQKDGTQFLVQGLEVTVSGYPEVKNSSIPNSVDIS